MSLETTERLRDGPEGALYCFGQQIALALLLPLLLLQLYSRRSVHKQAYAEPLEDLRQFPGALPLSWERFFAPRLHKEAPSLGPTKPSKR